VRDEIAAVAPPEARYANRSGKLRLLVVGGSLGAQTMNDLVLAAIASMRPDERPEIVHQAGEKLYDGLRAAYAKENVKAQILPFVDDMAARYAWCDVLVCRSGAITVAEITAAGVASILLPLPWFVADEQAANARFLADRGAGIALKQLETKPSQLAELLRGLDRNRLTEMARNARALGKPGATRACAGLCLELAHAA
jgi:UDP-N-acetylglucosamine--N-acetylmuramyl-(pentapeptide) pyrophosphoryl-undecaprenol N-acetylglucosamine transferase